MQTRVNHSDLNQYNYKNNAITHAELGLKSTLYLAYRDLPDLLKKHSFGVNNKNKYRLLDFGCGAGLSTEILSRIIKNCGFSVDIYGVDINSENLELAKKRLPSGKFQQIDVGKPIENLGTFDIVICNFVLLEHNDKEMLRILGQIHPLVSEQGVLLVTNCTGKAYNTSHKWYSFNNNFSENTPTEINTKGKLKLKDNQPVKLQVLSYDTGSSFCFFDYFHSGRAYREAYTKLGFSLVDTHKPMGRDSDGIEWKDEKNVSPYKIHVLKKEKVALEFKQIRSRL